jgi:hypothetical protein
VRGCQRLLASLTGKRLRRMPFLPPQVSKVLGA